MALFERWVELRVRFLSRYLGSATKDDFIIRTFRYHYLRLYGALWFMNNTLEVFYLNRGSEIEHRIRETIRQCVLYYRLHYDAIHRFKGVRPDFFIY